MPDWYYERAGTRAGPVDEAEMHRLLAAGTITRDTLIWSQGIGPNFVALGETALAPAVTEPPPLPARAVDDTLAWVLVAIPLGSAATGAGGGAHEHLAVGLAAGDFPDQRRGQPPRRAPGDPQRGQRPLDPARRLGLACPGVPLQRARALKGPRYYVWAWLVSFAASLFVGGEAAALLDGEAYLGTGVPACDSRYQIRQVRQLFDGLDAVKAAAIASTGVTNARELGAAGEVRTCAAQIGATNAQSYAVVYTVERRGDQVLTNLQVR